VAVAANLEVRWTFVKFPLFKQRISVQAAPFVDAGRVFDRVAFSFENWKVSAGGGLRIGVNQSTIVMFDFRRFEGRHGFLHRLRDALLMITQSKRIGAAVGLFTLLIAEAMRAYPGGTAWNPASVGHDFWFNYLCDLARTTALNGQPNGFGAKVTQLALFVLGAGALQFWWSLPRLFEERPRLARAIRILGAISAAGMLAVAVLPSDRFGALHPFLLAMAGGPGLGAAACSVIGLARRERVASLLGVCAGVACAVDFGLYGDQLAGDGPGRWLSS